MRHLKCKNKFKCKRLSGKRSHLFYLDHYIFLRKVGELLLKLIIYNIIKEKHKLENLMKEILYCAESKISCQKYPCSRKEEVLLQLSYFSKW